MSLISQFPQHAQPDDRTTMAIGLLCAIAIIIPISAVILRAACSFYNKMVGGPNGPRSVPEPDFGTAIGICGVAILVGGGFGMLLRFLGFVADLGPVAVTMISWPIGLIVKAVMLRSMLPTTFLRGLFVAVLEQVVGTLLLLIPVAIFVFGLK